jgi:ABC-type branched-subunit amino acid transport system substrate-binding protein
MLGSSWRPSGRLAGALLAASLVAACSTGGLGGIGLGALPLANPFSPDPPVASETLGTGTIKVAMLLPLSAEGSVGALARDLKNAAALALRDFPDANLQIVVKDDSGTPQGARAAANQAAAEGAELILGPLFADSVTAVTTQSNARNLPVVAFSTDTSRSSRGVYLLSFTPQGDVNRVIRYAASRGKRTFAALVPNTASGALYESEFQRAVAAAGGRVVSVERYDTNPQSMQERAVALGQLIAANNPVPPPPPKPGEPPPPPAGPNGIDAVFLPDGGDATPFIAQLAAANGVRPGMVTYLGSGQWNDPRVIRESNVSGGWYPGPDDTSFAAFSSRYRSAYGATPLRNATLAYDAVSLAAGLATKY